MIRYKKVWDHKAFTPQEARLYTVWHAIRHRCKNPSATFYRHYGGRGIIIHPEWDDDFSAFVRDVGFPPSEEGFDLDRINNNGNYEPGNVRWISHQGNSKNTRRARLVTIDGVTKNMSEWCDESGVGRPTMFRRLALGWEGKMLLTKSSDKAWASRYTINGETMTIEEWAKVIGISEVGLRMRIDRGLTGEELLAPTAKWKSSPHYKPPQIRS